MMSDEVRIHTEKIGEICIYLKMTAKISHLTCSGVHKALFKQAMRHWENYTCIQVQAEVIISNFI